MKLIVIFAFLAASATAENVRADPRLLNLIGVLWDLAFPTPTPAIVDTPVVVDGPFEPISVGPAIIGQPDYEPISVGPAIIEQEFEPISVGPAIIEQEFEPISVGPAIIQPIVPNPVAPYPTVPGFPMFSSPLVQMIVNVNSATKPKPAPAMVPEVEPTPVNVVDGPVIVEPVNVAPIIVPEPVVNLPGILN